MATGVHRLGNGAMTKLKDRFEALLIQVVVVHRFTRPVWEDQPLIVPKKAEL